MISRHVPREPRPGVATADRPSGHARMAQPPRPSENSPTCVGESPDVRRDFARPTGMSVLRGPNAKLGKGLPNGSGTIRTRGRQGPIEFQVLARWPSAPDHSHRAPSKDLSPNRDRDPSTSRRGVSGSHDTARRPLAEHHPRMDGSSRDGRQRLRRRARKAPSRPGRRRPRRLGARSPQPCPAWTDRRSAGPFRREPRTEARDRRTEQRS